MDYATLTGLRTVDGSIKAWLNNSTIPATVVLEEAEAYTYERLRVREMWATASGTIGSATETIALPSDYIQTQRLAITGTDAYELARRDPATILGAKAWNADGTRIENAPRQFCTFETYAQLDSPADDDYPYELLYVRRPAALGTGNTTNFLTNKHPRLLRSACLVFANEWLKKADDRQWWLTILENEIAQANQKSEAEQYRNADLMVITR